MQLRADGPCGLFEKPYHALVDISVSQASPLGPVDASEQTASERAKRLGKVRLNLNFYIVAVEFKAAFVLTERPWVTTIFNQYSLDTNP